MPSRKITVANLEAMSEDPIRSDIGSWTATQTGISYVLNDDRQYNISYEIPVEYTDGSSTQEITLTLVGQDTENIPSVVPEYVEIADQIADKTYEDLAASLETDITFEEATNLSLDTPSDTMGVDFVYNFVDQEYQNLLQTVENHNLIPSMYDLLDTSFITDDGSAVNLLRGTTFDILQNNLLGDQLRFRLIDGRQILLPSGVVTVSLSSTRELQNFSYLTNQMIVPENSAYIKQFEANKNLFPIYAQVNIPYREGTLISDAIEKSGLSGVLIREVFGAYPPFGTPISIYSQQMDYTYSYYTRGTLTSNIENFRSPNTKIFDIDSWVIRDSGGWSNGKELPDDWSFIGVEQNSEMLSIDPGGSAFASAYNDLRVRIASLKAQKAKTLEGLYNGEEAYSEIVMYRITKYLGQGIDTPIQNFYFYNTTDLIEFLSAERKITIVDTQVKYDQTYTYSVVAYQGIIGTSYSYTEPRVTSEGLKIKAVLTPTLKIVETPLFQSVGRVLSNPPLSPEIEFIPIKGQTDTIKMHLNTALGSEDMQPISFNDQEFLDYRQVGLNQRRTDGLITFQADDHNISYNIYRMSTPPNGYLDFANNLLTSVSTTIGNLEAGSATININQATNKKYYYIFRSIDSNGLLSNPSDVYEIELYDDGGAGYPIIRLYQFAEVDPTAPIKSARKLIQIIPRITQSYFNESRSGVANEDGTLTVTNKNLVLGVESESLFPATSGFGIKTGKRFKIRLTSKSTGKKVDINVDFNTNRVRSEIE